MAQLLGWVPSGPWLAGVRVGQLASPLAPWPFLSPCGQRVSLFPPPPRLLLLLHPAGVVLQQHPLQQVAAGGHWGGPRQGLVGWGLRPGLVRGGLHLGEPAGHQQRVHQGQWEEVRRQWVRMRWEEWGRQRVSGVQGDVGRPMRGGG